MVGCESEALAGDGLGPLGPCQGPAKGPPSPAQTALRVSEARVNGAGEMLFLTKEGKSGETPQQSDLPLQTWLQEQMAWQQAQGAQGSLRGLRSLGPDRLKSSESESAASVSQRRVRASQDSSSVLIAATSSWASGVSRPEEPPSLRSQLREMKRRGEKRGRDPAPAPCPPLPPPPTPW